MYTLLHDIDKAVDEDNRISIESENGQLLPILDNDHSTNKYGTLKSSREKYYLYRYTTKFMCRLTKLFINLLPIDFESLLIFRTFKWNVIIT